ncbi:MAG: hypothetical protein Q9219_003844 [cf. Caloplaca sp. 3 TL-2023]
MAQSRQLKNVIATTALSKTVSVCLVPGSRAAIGRAAYLGAIATVFAHPGRRFGQLVEALVLAITGTSLGLSWSLLGLYLSSLVINLNPAAAYSVRGVFLAGALLFHGYLRSKTPRLFLFVLLLIIVSVVTLTSTASAVTPVSATQILYPILLAVGVILVVNLFIFPEFSASFLGETTIATLHDTADSLTKAGHYFIETADTQTTEIEIPVKESGDVPPKDGEDAKPLQEQSKTSFVNLVKDLLRCKVQEQSRADKSQDSQFVKLEGLVRAKTKLRSKLSICKAAQDECNFEVAFAVLPPRKLKPISTQTMKSLVANVIAVIGACESKFALMGEADEQAHDNAQSEHSLSRPKPSARKVNVLQDRVVSGAPIIRKHAEIEKATSRENITIDSEKKKLDLVKPRREIEFGDVRLLQYLLQQIAPPYRRLSAVISKTIDCITLCIAYSYEVAKLPSRAKAPKRLSIEEIDSSISELSETLISFDVDIASALEGAMEKDGSAGGHIDIMPREEIFLIASFVLNLRQATSHLEQMLKSSRSLVLQRQLRYDRRRFYAPRIEWSKWLYAGGEEDEALPATGRKRNRRGEKDEKADDEPGADTFDSEENGAKSTPQDKDLEGGTSTGRNQSAPTGPLTQPSEASVASPKFQKNETTLLQLRGRLADSLEWVQNSDDLLYAFKLSIAVMLVTWPAFVARWNTWYSLNRGLWAALQLILITEVSIGTSVMTFILRGIGTTLGCLWGWAALEARGGNRIVVAAMVFVGLIPCTYVQLGTKYPKAGMVCIISISVVALSTELQTVPGSATENFLKRWLAFIIGGVVALVVEVSFLPVKARTRLVESLTAAVRQIREMETCIAAGIEERVNLELDDPKILQRFEQASGKANGALAAAEMFRKLNAQIYPYRRNVAGAVTLTLFAVETSLVSKIPLPQFFPSARLAHLRMINRVREVVENTAKQDFKKDMKDHVRHRAVRQKYMAWNASSAARAEIIEYLEELVDLAKLVVGANEFRSGLLMRTTYHDYAQRLASTSTANGEMGGAIDGGNEAEDDVPTMPVSPSGVIRRRRLTTIQSSGSAEDRVPASLQRIQSRKIEAGIRRQATNEGWNK